MNRTDQSIEVCRARRAAVARAMRERGGGVAVVPTARAALRNGDSEYPYRADSRFLWLTDFDEPDSVLVIVATADDMRTAVFLRPNDPDRETWTGPRLGVDAAPAALGVDEAFAIDALDTMLPTWLANMPALFYPIARDRDLDLRVARWLDAVRAMRGRAVPGAAIDIAPLVDALRLIKDATEIARMRHAAAISADAHRRAMRATRPGLHEYAIEAELLHEFRRRGALAPAYGSIVAGGANACVLHYERNDAVLRDGDLLLIDAGCEVDGYAADITRTFPINGRFTGEQRAVYEVVLAAQAAAIAQVAPGRRFDAAHDAAVRVLAQGLLDLGALRGTLDGVIESKAYRRFYMHGTGHWLGLDVHDAGDYREPGSTPSDHGERPYRSLEAGMVVTVEPGLYFRAADDVPSRWHGIGIRIEDDVNVTTAGPEVLSADAPKTPDAIEQLMRAHAHADG